MKKEKLKQRIFESAKQIVAKEGIDKLNARAVAQMSNCSLGSLYNAFENFESLKLHINAFTLSELFLALRGEIAKDIELRDVFHELGKTYIAFAQKHPMLWKAIFEHFPEKELPSWYRKQAQKGIYGICQTLAEKYQLPLVEVKQMVGFYWSAMHGLSAIMLNRKMEMVSELFKKDYLESYIDSTLNGLLGVEVPIRI